MLFSEAREGGGSGGVRRWRDEDVNLDSHFQGLGVEMGGWHPSK